MSEAGFRHARGPVSSLRSARSLGIDLVPFKMRPFDCIYCQLGRMTNNTLEGKQCVAKGGRHERSHGH
jgi:wyosine [tRNA(Phe)-imidazoG37] synthetase (radical SAM superfamily)